MPRNLFIDLFTQLEQVPTLKNFNNYDTLQICYDGLDETLFEIFKQYGKPVKKLVWFMPPVLKTSKIIEILNLMPQLEEIDYDPNEGFIFEESSEKLNLPHLKTLHVNYRPTLELFSHILPPNSLRVLLVRDNWTSDPTAFPTLNLQNFISCQRSIKVIEIGCKMSLDALSMLTLDELKIDGKFEARDVFNAIKNQPQLKTLKIQERIGVKIFMEVCKLSTLEFLALNLRKIKDIKKLEDLKNLKHLELEDEINSYNIKMESIEKLSIMHNPIHNSEILEMIANNFPNLKYFQVSSSQKLNFFAKIFPNLEALKLYTSIEGLKFYEPDTGIVSQNLKVLDLMDFSDFCKIFEESFEVFEIFPNLEVLKIDVNPCELHLNDNRHVHLLDKNFYAKLNKMKHLKHLEVEYLNLKFNRRQLMEIAEEIKKLSQKIKFLKLKFNDKITRDPETEVDVRMEKLIHSTYDFFVEEMKENFQIKREGRARLIIRNDEIIDN